MISKAGNLEHDILRAFRCACRQDRSDIAEYMLAALEKLDSERVNCDASNRPLMDAYREMARTSDRGRL